MHKLSQSFQTWQIYFLGSLGLLFCLLLVIVVPIISISRLAVSDRCIHVLCFLCRWNLKDPFHTISLFRMIPAKECAQRFKWCLLELLEDKSFLLENRVKIVEINTFFFEWFHFPKSFIFIRKQIDRWQIAVYFWKELFFLLACKSDVGCFFFQNQSNITNHQISIQIVFNFIKKLTQLVSLHEPDDIFFISIASHARNQKPYFINQNIDLFLTQSWVNQFFERNIGGIFEIEDEIFLTCWYWLQNAKNIDVMSWIFCQSFLDQNQSFHIIKWSHNILRNDSSFQKSWSIWFQLNLFCCWVGWASLRYQTFPSVLQIDVPKNLRRIRTSLPSHFAVHHLKSQTLDLTWFYFSGTNRFVQL